MRLISLRGKNRLWSSASVLKIGVCNCACTWALAEASGQYTHLRLRAGWSGSQSGPHPPLKPHPEDSVLSPQVPNERNPESEPCAGRGSTGRNAIGRASRGTVWIG